PASTREWTTTLAIPRSRHARTTRTAISPRFATSTLSNTQHTPCSCVDQPRRRTGPSRGGKRHRQMRLTSVRPYRTTRPRHRQPRRLHLTYERPFVRWREHEGVGSKALYLRQPHESAGKALDSNFGTRGNMRP